jgi:hypothetical protein
MVVGDTDTVTVGAATTVSVAELLPEPPSPVHISV